MNPRTGGAPGLRWLGGVCGLLFVAQLVQGLAVYVVDRTDDVASANVCSPSPNDCSLRGAIGKANSDSTDSRIELPDALFQLTIAGSDEEFNQTGDLDITAALDIMAQPASHPVIEQTTVDRVLQIRPGAGPVTITGPLTIQGGQAVNSNGFGTGGGIDANQHGELTLTDVILRDNQAEFDGGCLYYFRSQSLTSSLTLDGVTIEECHAAKDGGGAFFSTSSTPALVSSTTIRNNTANQGGGGLFVSGGASVIIEDTSITGNVAGSPMNSGIGGGIFHSNGVVWIRQSIIAKNRAGVATGTSGSGGGLRAGESAVLLIQNTTISGNTTLGSFQRGAGLSVESSASVTLQHTTVAESYTTGSLLQTIDVPNGGGTLVLETSIIDGGCNGNTAAITSNGFNVERPWDGSTNTSCNLINPSDQITLDPKLKKLAPYGWPLETHALASGSPAISLVPSVSCLPEDQRHAARGALFCDAGAYELAPTTPPPDMPLFVDDFESGNLSAWSSSAP